MIRSAMNDIPEDRWLAAFGKKEPPKEQDGGWVEEQLDNQKPIIVPSPEPDTNEC